jgi:phthiodiolone/phenolphthiodiolone dimycocerosates ketoreductase
LLGIGTGERESNVPYGVDWSKPVARFEEAVATIRALWDSNGELVTRDSPFFPLHKATFGLPPYKGKWPPIWPTTNGHSAAVNSMCNSVSPRSKNVDS